MCSCAKENQNPSSYVHYIPFQPRLPPDHPFVDGPANIPQTASLHTNVPTQNYIKVHAGAAQTSTTNPSSVHPTTFQSAAVQQSDQHRFWHQIIL